MMSNQNLKKENPTKNFLPHLAALGIAFATGNCWAIAGCTNVSNASPAPAAATTIVVASNFYGPAQDLVSSFLATLLPTTKTIRVCHDSTATIYGEITGTPAYPYTLFLAANATTPTSLQGTSYVQSGATAFRYAYGIPVLYTNSDTTGLTKDDLIEDGISSLDSTATADGYADYVRVNESNVDSLGIGNVPGAPYGVAARTILTAMKQWLASPYGSGTAPTNGGTGGACTSGDLCMYNNIDYTLQAIENGDVTAGFVSWGQVCAENSNWYVTFSDYPLDQKGILLNVDGNPATTSAAEQLAADLKTYMNLGSAGWNTWLNNRCYGSI